MAIAGQAGKGGQDERNASIQKFFKRVLRKSKRD